MPLKKEFLQLFKSGKAAAKQGDFEKAHTLFRRAIEIDPYHVQVWFWLATVVDTDEDRIVCFQNALKIDPVNTTALRQLRRLQGKKIAEALNPQSDDRKRHSRSFRRHKVLFGLAAFLAVLGGLGLIAFALLV